MESLFLKGNVQFYDHGIFLLSVFRVWLASLLHECTGFVSMREISVRAIPLDVTEIKV